MTQAPRLPSLRERLVAGASRPFVIDLVRYGLVSVAALLCDYGLLLVLVAGGLHYLVAAAISFSAGMGVAYALSVRFVFPDRRDRSRLREAAGFFAVGFAGLLLTQLLLIVFVSGLSLDVAIAKIPTTGCVFIFNFLARRGLVFTGLRPALA
ncbi:GtrA family protein [Beijerinckia sp. L45]|uniref:GtrA family protein n=1 Tax=Beijerinckia sp. L45 TaxID=1641855 RepID=UPI001FEFA3BC|nr:GtrA family protein [Beijerinckia sp. L45]